MTTPRQAGFSMPAEWAPHAATWFAWPSAAALWQDALEPARVAVALLVAAVAKGERADVLVPDEANEQLARIALPGPSVSLHRVPFGDIWLRDTAPIVLSGPGGELATVRFAFNGWGGKYVLEHDDGVSTQLATRLEGRSFVMPWVLEGGAVEVDGEGTVLTTRQCLLNPNRNPAMTADAIELGLRDALGCEKVLWLGDGLQNDHTDGHVDTIARFVQPGVVVIMEPAPRDDPNRDVLEALRRDLAALVDARGRRLEIVRIPSPGRVEGADGRVAPASYVNFYVSNAAVVVPTYASASDDEAVRRIASLFPGRTTIGVDARAVLTGGGAFHCITQQVPRAMGPKSQEQVR